jgi:phosphoribosylamine---glycine ligase
MKVLLIGSGGREHCLALKLAESPKLTKLFIAPGNAGTAEVGENIDIKDTQIDELLDFALSNKIDLTIVGPEAPLVAGVVDIFKNKGLAIIGPDKVGAQLEGSKKWAKTLMLKYGIPTAMFQDFDDYDEACKYLKQRNEYPIVIKADGLAAGKGVTVAHSEEDAVQALKTCFLDRDFSEAGDSVVIEDFLEGEEASIFAFTDGKTVLPMTPAQDHKAIFEGDTGPNTGGMGAYSPAPIVTNEIEDIVKTQVFDQLITAFQQEGIDYTGILYAGLMIKNGELKIVEFNARFGDPETQVVIPRLENDLIDIFMAMVAKELDKIELKWKKESAVCVVLASGGYPGSYEKGKKITGLDNLVNERDFMVIHAGTKIGMNGDLLTNGGRVLGVVGMHQDLGQAIEYTYEKIKGIDFEGMYFREDIGFKALKN